MTEQPPQLSTLSEAQRRQALERFVILRPDPEEGVPQTQIALGSRKASRQALRSGAVD